MSGMNWANAQDAEEISSVFPCHRTDISNAINLLTLGSGKCCGAEN